MNKARTLPLLLLIMSICALGTANAAVSLTANDLSGTVEQKETYTGTISISNTGDNVSLSISAADITDGSNTISAGDVAFSPTTISNLANGDIATIDVTIDIDNDQEPGTYTGTITITWNNGTETGTETVNIELDVELGNHLIIDRVTVVVDGNSDRVEDGEKVGEEAYPQSEVEITVRVENDYDDNIDIEDIEVEIDADNDLDWNEREDMDDLRRGDRDSITFTFTVPRAQYIDEGTYDIDIIVTGEDEDGNDHRDEWAIELEVDKKRYDLQFRSVSISPSYVEACTTINPQLRVNIENAGTRDIDRGTLLITGEALKDEVIVRDMDIEEGDDLTKEVALPLRENLDPGQYFITIQVFTEPTEDDQTDITSADLVILACTTDEEDEEEEEEEEEDEIDIVTPTPSTGTTGSVVATTTGTPSKLLDRGSTTYLALLILIVVLLVILIVVVAASALGGKK
ncbi:hypothetical protein JXA12_01180 [Candidatus Woesearchaeota archaeon]|nr:hypothetical protein [Candidatus Woesearchaeota archaeon]